MLRMMTKEDSPSMETNHSFKLYMVSGNSLLIMKSFSNIGTYKYDANNTRYFETMEMIIVVKNTTFWNLSFVYRFFS